MDNKRLTRRRFIAIGLLPSFGALVAACAPRVVERVVRETVVLEGTAQVVEKVVTATPPPARPAVNVTLTISGTQDQAKNYLRALEIFNAGHPGVNADLEHVPSAEYGATMQTRLAAGTAADVFQMEAGMWINYEGKGVALSLEPFIASTPGFDKADFFDVPREFFTYQGELYGLPAYGGPLVTYYNTEAFEEVGLDPLPTDVAQADDWNWDALIAAAGKLTKREGDLVTRWGWVAPHEEWFIYIYSGGARLLNEDATRCLLDSEEAIAALQWMHDAIYKHKVAPAKTMVTQRAWNLFPAGRVGVMIDRRWVSSSYVRQGLPRNWRLAPLPKGPGGRRSTTSSWAFSVYAKTKSPDEAWILASWLAGTEGILTLGIEGVPQRKSITMTQTFLADTNSPEENRIFVDQMADAVFQPAKTPKWNQLLQEAFNPELDRLWADKATAREVALAMTKKANEILAS